MADNGTQSVNTTSPKFSKTIQFLMLDSKQALDNGNYQLAGRIIERAIRIEINNPWLWHNLAVVRVRQKEYQSAIQLGLKSNDLSNEELPKWKRKLQLNNWKLIHFCHLELGETKNAKKALKIVKNLSF